MLFNYCCLHVMVVGVMEGLPIWPVLYVHDVVLETFKLPSLRVVVGDGWDN